MHVLKHFIQQVQHLMHASVILDVYGYLTIVCFVIFLMGQRVAWIGKHFTLGVIIQLYLVWSVVMFYRPLKHLLGGSDVYLALVIFAGVTLFARLGPSLSK